ncbi:MAG: hypothetical protein R3324_08480 [Halobacteriales archaeon]|nr:hypothetical protein [Halobacteriales archaeon]
MGEGRSSSHEDSDPREVVVPLSVYKIVVVFSTLISGGLVVGGFLVLDAATRRARAPPSEIDPLLVLLGLGLIAGGAVVYAFSARFRAAGMETDKGSSTEPNGNG